MILNQENCLFFIIDVQEKLLNAVFNKDSVENKTKILAKASSILSIPLLVTEQYPQGLGATIAGVGANAQIFEKISFNALEVAQVLNAINNVDAKQIVIWGIETHICVYQTVVALLEEGFDVTVVSDACGSRLETEYISALECMKQNGAKIKTTEMVLFELLKTAKHPKFKEIQALIK